MGRRWRRFPRPRPHPQPLGRRLSGRSRPNVDARAVAHRIAENVERVIIGKRGQVELAVMTLMCGGPLLVEDVPGVGKTMLARTLAPPSGGALHPRPFPAARPPT